MSIQLSLGKIIENKQEKDAIHIAVAPMIAGEKLYPGQHVGIENGKATAVLPHIAIVDPFLTHAVWPDQEFWLFLYPNTITSLRHDWIHPAFEDKNPSVKWMEDFALEAGLSYSALIEAAKDYLATGEYLCDGGRWEGFYTPDEFWPHFEIVTATKLAPGQGGNFFTCSC